MQDGDNRARILDAARRLFERNPGGFTVSSVCRETGLSRAKLRKHFPSKGALIASLKQAGEQSETQLETHAQSFVAPMAENEAVAQAPSILPIAVELPPIVTEPEPTAARPKKKRPPAATFHAR